MEKKPHILLTNDDGIHAEGLLALANSLASWARVSVIAPDAERSGSGMGLTLYSPLTLTQVSLGNAINAWKVSGTPADCIRLGLSVVLKEPPHCILSGINRGANSGKTVLSSGTIGGAIEGALRGIPAMALSSMSFEEPNHTLALPFIRPLTEFLLSGKLPQGTILNVNFPSVHPVEGLRLARQGRGFWKEDPEGRLHPEGHTYYWLGGKWHSQEEHHESDVHLLRQGFATAVPIRISELTDSAFLDEHRASFESLFASQ